MTLGYVSMGENEHSQRTEDWFERRDPSTGAPVRFVERRRGDRRRSAKRLIEALPQHAEPLPTVSLIIPTKNKDRATWRKFWSVSPTWCLRSSSSTHAPPT